MPATAAWRCFVAVPIGSELRRALGAAVEEWRAPPEASDLRWADPGSWHLTLAFLGATDPSRVPAITQALEAIAGEGEPFTVTCGGIGAFPSPRRARVVWYGVTDGAERLAELAADVSAAVGLDVARPFHGHVTLGRARGERPLDVTWLTAETPPEGSVTVDRIELMRSHLGSGPARYETVASVPLGAPVHA